MGLCWGYECDLYAVAVLSRVLQLDRCVLMGRVVILPKREGIILGVVRVGAYDSRDARRRCYEHRVGF